MADRHQRDTDARPTRRPVLVAAPLALVATASAVTLGIVLQSPGDAAPARATTASQPLGISAEDPGAASTAAPATTAPDAPAAPVTEGADSADGTDDAGDTERAPILSRSDARRSSRLQVAAKPNLVSEVATRQAIREAKKADTQLWVTDDLNLWTAPGEKADEVGELEAGRQVLVTGRELWGRTEVVVQGRSQWVTAGYLSEEEPVVLGAGAGLSNAPCPDGSVESGLTDSAVLVYRSVCNAFPAITTYGGFDNHGEHSTGKALDIMTSDVALGTAIAEFLRSHAAELDLYDIIWRQRIFTQERGGEGWRGMSSRGSATADHYDHVHVATY